MCNNFDFIQYIEDQKEWSLRTFGPGDKTEGLVDHIEEELVEILDDPNLMEWVDVIILALDGAWRRGYSSRDIVEGLLRKQRINREEREWPDWRTATPGKAIKHIK